MKRFIAIFLTGGNITKKQFFWLGIPLFAFIFLLTACTSEKNPEERAPMPSQSLQIIENIEQIDYIEISKTPSPPVSHRTGSPQQIAEIAEYINTSTGVPIESEPYGGWEINVTVYYKDNSRGGFCVSDNRLSDASGKTFEVTDAFCAQLLCFYNEMEEMSSENLL